VLERVRRWNWRRWFRVFHRDIGYVAVALILAYGISGIAVNHIDDWNPNYRFDNRDVAIGPLPTGSLAEREAYVIDKLAIARTEVNGHFREANGDFRVYLGQGQEVRVRPDGVGRYLGLAKRKVFFEVNVLHLNNLKGAWTYIADAFAGALIILALTGMTMMKGDRGFLGRGKYFVAAGLAIPVAAIVYLYA